MAVPMRRGSNVALTREIPGLKGLVIGFRYNAGAEHVLGENLVTATILCGADSMALSDEHVVFFNQLTSPDLSVSQLEKALGDDTEQVEIDLAGVPPEVRRLVFVLYINEGIAQRRSLSQLRECSIRVLNLDDNTELVRSESLLPDSVSGPTLAIVLGEVYRHEGHWKFKVVGEGYQNGIRGVAADYGVPL
jgi:tellurium resistance protein TerD